MKKLLINHVGSAFTEEGKAARVLVDAVLDLVEESLHGYRYTDPEIAKLRVELDEWAEGNYQDENSPDV